MLGLNMLPDVALLIHALVADPTVVKPIFRSQNILLKILWVCDGA